jgi:hypothetical protein
LPNGTGYQNAFRDLKGKRVAFGKAKPLLSDAPDLAAQVESLASSLAAAYEQLQERREQAGRKAVRMNACVRS